VEWNYVLELVMMVVRSRYRYKLLAGSLTFNVRANLLDGVEFEEVSTFCFVTRT
jgi:hypothetical protein